MNVSNPFTCLGHLQDYFSLWLPKPKEWRLVAKPIVGQINGLPQFRGLAVATNGIHVAILTSADHLLVGHLEWFLPDEQSDVESDLFTTAKPSLIRIPKEFDELFV